MLGWENKGRGFGRKTKHYKKNAGVYTPLAIFKLLYKPNQ